MSEKELKTAFHKLIDEVDNDQLLEDNYKILNQHKHQTTDITDDLTDEQKLRLNSALPEAENGKVISDKDAQIRIQS